MITILTDLSEPALINAIKSNLHEFFRYLRHAPTTEFYESQKLVRWHTPLPHPWMNGVICLQPPSDGDEQTVRDTLAYFQSRNVPVITWWLDAGLDKANWEKYLTPHGFGYDVTPGMALDMKNLSDDIKRPSGLSIKPVDDTEALKVWIQTLVAGFGMPAEWERDIYNIFESLGLDLPLRNYTAYMDGKPVATSSLFLAAGVAGIMFVSTLPEARGKGIGAAMTLAPLYDAREMGYRVGILQSSDMGYRVYRRLGFQELCKVGNFYYRFVEKEDES